MNKLENARNDINIIDEQLAKLFVKRIKAVQCVIEYKIENNMPILDEAREMTVIKNNIEKLDNKHLEKYYEQFIINLMDICKQYQKDQL